MLVHMWHDSTVPTACAFVQHAAASWLILPNVSNVPSSAWIIQDNTVEKRSMGLVGFRAWILRKRAFSAVVDDNVARIATDVMYHAIHRYVVFGGVFSLDHVYIVDGIRAWCMVDYGCSSGNDGDEASDIMSLVFGRGWLRWNIEARTLLQTASVKLNTSDVTDQSAPGSLPGVTDQDWSGISGIAARFGLDNAVIGAMRTRLHQVYETVAGRDG